MASVIICWMPCIFSQKETQRKISMIYTALQKYCSCRAVSLPTRHSFSVNTSIYRLNCSSSSGCHHVLRTPLRYLSMCWIILSPKSAIPWVNLSDPPQSSIGALPQKNTVRVQFIYSCGYPAFFSSSFIAGRFL